MYRLAWIHDFKYTKHYSQWLTFPEVKFMLVFCLCDTVVVKIVHVQHTYVSLIYVYMQRRFIFRPCSYHLVPDAAGVKINFCPHIH